MQVKQIVNQSLAAGTHTSNPVSLMSYGGAAGAIGSVTVQFNEGSGAVGEITLQGRLSPSASWDNLTTDTSGRVQVVAAVAEYRTVIVAAGTAIKQCWIGG